MKKSETPKRTKNQGATRRGPAGKGAAPAAAKRPAAGQQRPVTGQHGGHRPGAGRPRAQLPQAALDRVGRPPVASPLMMARWWSQLLGELAWLYATGEVGPEMVAVLKSLAGTAGRLVPEDLRAEVDKQIKALDAALKPEAQGPQPEEPSGEQPPLRVLPR